MIFVAFCCSFWFLVCVSICRSLPFAALRCSFLFFILSQKLKQANAFCCSLLPFVASFGFLWMLPFEHRNVRRGFLLVRKTKKSNKKPKNSKWKPGLSEIKAYILNSEILISLMNHTNE